MRHTTLLLCSLIASAAVAQDYLANDPVWRVHSICAVPVPCIADNTYNYFTAGDSAINGVIWTKIYQQGIVNLNWQGGAPADPNCQGTHFNLPNPAAVQLIRQDGRQLRYWYNNADELLHDFDLVVGDTLPLSFTNWNPDITVLAVDSLLIGTEMRARYELGNSWAQYLIEGVGSTHGLFEPLSNFLECGFELLCFGLGTEAFYPDANAPSCWMSVAVDERPAPISWTMAPDPAGHTLSITSTVAVNEVAVQDLSGRMVLRERPAALQVVSLDVSGLPNGCYVLSVDQTLPRRFVVAH